MKQNILTQTHNSLIKKQKTVSVAESCTGGMLSEMLTRNSGSSKYFLLGIASYSNKAKIKILRVPESIIFKKGAVSKETCRRMAQSIRILAGSDLGIGITGIAGPTGETTLKPIGTVFIAIDSKNKKLCEKLNFKGSREKIRKQAALKALTLLKTII
ncbi:MAG: CinA family protein [Candidatus Omnitrophota bacterium]